MKKRFLLIFLTLVLIMAVGCANEEPAEITDQSTDSVEEVEVARGIKIDYDVEYEQEIFGDASKDEIYEIIDDIFEKVSDDEDYENNIDSIIEEVFKDHGITDEDNLDFA
ncbi:hypothetical protein AT727_23680 [Desulfitobacterium hafniense]|uniref:Prokaryotic membrane lipoprotein lipid attachment site profile n=1 Tax=Desulfitobacterium hafniense TaxID=49338 RepID=A0A0W1JGW7_DESHA|nr:MULTISPECIES: hypothetical protein [Bacillota]KTE90795.1 hypothetical protein AT727_23680 [Desulfitobacterium hafniense]